MEMATSTPTLRADALTPTQLAALQQEIEQWLQVDRLQEGAHWYLVSSAWWRATFPPPTSNVGASSPDANELADDANNTDSSDNPNDGEGDVDMDEGGEGLPATRQGKPRVENAALVDVANSCRKRGVVVLKPRLAEGHDFRIVSERVWNKLSNVLGYDWAIMRDVVAVEGTKLKVDVYPVLFRLAYWRSGMDAPQPVHDTGGGDSARPFVLALSDSTSLLELQNRIQQTLLPRLSEFFPALTRNDVNSDLQIAFRVDDAAPWVPLADAVAFQMDEATTSVADLQLQPRDFNDGDDRFHTLLIESKYASDPTDESDPCDWRVGRFYSDVCANVWRFQLQLNQLVDAEDTDKKWYESRIIDVKDTEVRVHFRGWTPKWDEWLDRLSPRLAPLHTRVRNWRDFRVGDAVQVGFPIPTRAYPEWRNAVVDKIDKTDEHFRVQVVYDGRNKWMDVQDEMLCAPGTHKAVNAATTTNTSRVSTLSTAARPTYGGHNRNNYTYDYGRGKPEYVGVVGLQNLGNTCFMNSMLQCLNNAKPLKDYFLASENGQPLFEKDVNEANPLGMKGMIAREFARLIHRMWGGEYTTVSPMGLKSVIGKYAPQFAGYQQQDSQEVMNFILDGLHEDLNRVKDKPYTKPVERNGRNDDEVAADEWSQYLRRNDSVIVDNFMGQLRSHVTCSNPECANESITFDPFMSLSVPIPSDESVPVKVQLFWSNGSIPTKYAVHVDKDATIRDVKEKLSALADVPYSRLFFVEVRGHKIKRTHRDSMPVDDISEDILHAYELEFPVTEYEVCSSNLRSFLGPLNTNTKKSMRLVALLHQAPVASPVEARHEDDDVLSNGGAYGPKQRRVEVELFNTPLLLSFDPELTKEQVNDKIWQVVKRLVGDDSSFDDKNLPYRLHISHPNGTSAGLRDFPRSSEPALLPGSTEEFCFTLEWSRKGYHLGYDEKSAKRIELHESMRNLKISSAPQDDVSLLSCITKFTEREQLGKTDTWYCPKCKEHVRAFKKFDLFSLPKVVIFQLKRFRYAQSSFYMHRDKITTLVTFPIDSLDLGPYVIGPQRHGGLVYDLFAVSEHSGGLGGGHYTAIGKNPENSKWFSYNDSFTKVASPQDAVTPRAYVLFYVRRE